MPCVLKFIIDLLWSFVIKIYENLKKMVHGEDTTNYAALLRELQGIYVQCLIIRLVLIRCSIKNDLSL